MSNNFLQLHIFVYVLCVQTEDGQSIGDPTDEGMEADEDYFQGVQADERGADEFVWPQRTTVDVVGAVQDAYARVYDLHNGAQQPGQIPQPEMEPEDIVKYMAPIMRSWSEIRTSQSMKVAG